MNHQHTFSQLWKVSTLFGVSIPPPPPQVDGCVTCVVCVCTCVRMSMYVTPSAKYTKTLLNNTRPADDRTIDEVCINVFFFLESERVDPFFFFFLLLSPPKSRHRSLREEMLVQGSKRIMNFLQREREKFRRGLRVQVSLSYNDIPFYEEGMVYCVSAYQSPCVLCVMDEDNGRRVDLGTHLPPQPPIPGKGENSKKLQGFGFVVLR